MATNSTSTDPPVAENGGTSAEAPNSSTFSSNLSLEDM